MPKQPKTPKTKEQLKAIFGLANGLGFAEEDIRDLAEAEFGSRSLSRLTFVEANHLIKRLNGRPFTAPRQQSRRTEQYHRQEAGVKTLVSATHLDLLNSRARQRGMTKEGLESLCLRIIKVKKPRTSTECNKVIEAIKAMTKRDNAFQFKKEDKEAA